MLRDENVKQQEITKNAIVLIAGSRASRSNDVPMSLMRCYMVTLLTSIYKFGALYINV